MEIVKFPYLLSMISQRYHDGLATEKVPTKTTLRRLQENGVQEAPNKKRLSDFLNNFTIMKTAICNVVGSMEKEITTRASNRFRSRLEKGIEGNSCFVE